MSHAASDAGSSFIGKCRGSGTWNQSKGQRQPDAPQDVTDRPTAVRARHHRPWRQCAEPPGARRLAAPAPNSNVAISPEAHSSQTVSEFLLSLRGPAGAGKQDGPDAIVSYRSGVLPEAGKQDGPNAIVSCRSGVLPEAGKQDGPDAIASYRSGAGPDANAIHASGGPFRPKRRLSPPSGGPPAKSVSQRV